MSVLKHTWRSFISDLILYREKFNSYIIPSSNTDYLVLRNKLQYVRSHKNLLSEEQRKDLQSIGFSLTPMDSIWDDWFEQLLKFKSENGHANIPFLDNNYYELSIWLSNQKRRLHKETLPYYRLEKLANAGVNWAIVAFSNH